MKKIGFGLATALIMVAMLLMSSPPANALSLFGFNFSFNQAQASQPPPVVTNDQPGADPLSTLADDFTQNANDTCLRYSQHVYEVCTAYVMNSSLGALVPYYKYAHSNDMLASYAAAYHLASRYTGQAYEIITSRVAFWPPGTMEVSTPDIKILSASSDLSNNTATLQTEETWRVTDQTGQVLFEEANAHHTITMQRVPSYLLHKWVVTSIQ